MPRWKTLMKVVMQLTAHAHDKELSRRVNQTQLYLLQFGGSDCALEALQELESVLGSLHLHFGAAC